MHIILPKYCSGRKFYEYLLVFIRIMKIPTLRIFPPRTVIRKTRYSSTGGWHGAHSFRCSTIHRPSMCVRTFELFHYVDLQAQTLKTVAVLYKSPFTHSGSASKHNTPRDTKRNHPMTGRTNSTMERMTERMKPVGTTSFDENLPFHSRGVVSTPHTRQKKNTWK